MRTYVDMPTKSPGLVSKRTWRQRIGCGLRSAAFSPALLISLPFGKSRSRNAVVLLLQNGTLWTDYFSLRDSLLTSRPSHHSNIRVDGGLRDALRVFRLAR